MATAKEIVYGAIAEALNVEEATLTEDTNVSAGLGASSVDFVHIVGTIQDKTDLTVPFMPFRRNKTIGEMVEYIEELMEE